MARMRTVKPEFFKDQDLAEELPGRDGRDARQLYVGLWGLADEHARLRGDARYIKGEIFPYDDDITPADVERFIDMIVASGRAVRYRVRASVYLFLPKLAEHQRLEPDKVPSRLPRIDEGEVDDRPTPPPSSTSETRPDESASRANESAPDADSSALRQVAGSRLHVAGGMAAPREHARAAPTEAEPPPDAPPAGQAEQILAEWRSTLRTKPQRAIANAIGLIVHSALAEGQDPDHVREALKRWQAKGTLHHKTLPSLIHEVANGPEPSTDLVPATRASPNPGRKSANEQAVEGWMSMPMPPREAFG